MDLGLGQGIYTSNTNGTINGVNNGVIHGTANGVWNEANYIDPNAQAFIVAARITNMMQKSAINMLVKLLKSAGIWSKCNAIYPFVGGNQRSHSFNLINTAQYQLTFFGGWTHASTGATPNGTTGYADTGLVPNSVLTFSSVHFSKYNRNDDVSGNKIDGVLSDSSTRFFQMNYSAGNGIVGDIGSVASYSPTNTKKLFIVSRTASNLVNVYRDGSNVATNTNTISNLATESIFLGARNSGSGTIQFYNAYEAAFASIGSGLNNAEAAALNTIVQIYQTILNRNV